jgi:uncharacterized protein YdeI (YjbR/CyaY-like superfamily)
MEMKKVAHFKNRNEWRKWLAKFHNKEKELWLVYFKKNTGIESVPYEDSVEEALCFGWIDSLIQKIDEEKYARKFTPRINSAKWSEPNIKRMKKMIAEGKMTEAGRRVADDKALMTDVKADKQKRELVIPVYIMTALRKNNKANKFFESLAPSHKKLYVGWIDSAVKQETKEKRLAEALKRLSAGEKLGMK